MQYVFYTEPREQLVTVVGLQHNKLDSSYNNTFRTTVTWKKPLFTYSDVKHYRYKTYVVSDVITEKKRRQVAEPGLKTVSYNTTTCSINLAYLYLSHFLVYIHIGYHWNRTPSFFCVFFFVRLQLASHSRCCFFPPICYLKLSAAFIQLLRHHTRNHFWLTSSRCIALLCILLTPIPIYQ